MYQRRACKMSITKLLQESRGENLCDLRLGREFSGITPRAEPITEKKYVNETSQKLKTFALGKMKRPAQTCRKYLHIT